MEKLTHGPWKLDKYGVVTGGPDDCVVVILPEQQANAKLIAAAPELLKALKYIVEWKPDNWSPEIGRELARNAITKAEGRA